uniref:Uncharacterized protein n=1 Tax=Brassica oleracea TaxID=3712 RepID=A0A3P6H3S9_BRAOL|nr:unnamed protein product [Brassica oleracea]
MAGKKQPYFQQQRLHTGGSDHEGHCSSSRMAPGTSLGHYAEGFLPLNRDLLNQPPSLCFTQMRHGGQTSTWRD